ncbi:MAG TPA: hypothetical protein VFX19_14375 [Dehalococcoidia bacterium]|jgi:hypothetical protein|nr:hypothetical protein [Dehalococcoidia bacterium]
MASDTGTAVPLEDLRTALQQPLALLATDRRSEVQAYIDAAMPHLERAVLDVLARLIEAFNAEAFNAATADVTAHLELTREGARISFDAATTETEPGTSFNDADVERLTLRLPKRLKELIDTEANHEGVSANSWYVHQLARALQRQLRRGEVSPLDLRDAPSSEEAQSGPRQGRPARRPYRGRHPGDGR